MHAERNWREYDHWPPQHVLTPFFLGTNGTLTAGDGKESKSSLETVLPLQPRQPSELMGCFALRQGSVSYEYDPRDPTPVIGGPSFDPNNLGSRDQRPLERRKDVLVRVQPAHLMLIVSVCGLDGRCTRARLLSAI